MANSDNSHLIAAYYSFIEPKSMKGWVGLVGWHTADDLPISCRFGAGQWKFAGQRLTFYHWTTPPTLAPCPWPCSLAGYGLQKRRSAPSYGPLRLRKDFSCWSIITIIITAAVSDLCCGGATRRCIVQENPQYVRYNVWQVNFKVSAKSGYNLLQQQDNGVL